MRKNLLKTIAVAGILTVATSLNAQEILKEATFTPEGKADITNLKVFNVDKAKNEIVLSHLTKYNTKKSAAEIIYFDLDLNYLRTENLEEEYEKIKNKVEIKLDPASTASTPERFPLIRVTANLATGQPTFSKGYIVADYNYNSGMVGDKFDSEEKIKPNKGEEDRIKYVTHWSNNDILNYRRQVSHYASSNKYSTTYVSYQESDATQMIRGDKGDLVLFGAVTTNMIYTFKDPEIGKKYVTQIYSVQTLTKTKETPLNFDVMAAPIYSTILYSGNIAFLFQRLDQKLEFIELDYDGNTVRRFIKDSPTDGVWCVSDMEELDNGDIIISGIVSQSTFSKVGLSTLVSYPQLMDTKLKEFSAKSSGYQIMSVNSKGINFVAFNPIEDFKKTFTPIEGAEKGKAYSGGYIDIKGIAQTKSGDFIVNGQIKNLYNEMQDMVLFYFNKEGKLISNFSTPILEKTIIPAEQQLVQSPHSDDVYWVINELAGQENYGDRTQMLKVTKIAKIISGGKKINAFVTPGNGKSYLDEKFSITQLGDDSYLFFGWDKKGKKMTLSKVKLE